MTGRRRGGYKGSANASVSDRDTVGCGTAAPTSAAAAARENERLSRGGSGGLIGSENASCRKESRGRDCCCGMEGEEVLGWLLKDCGDQAGMCF